MKTVFIDIDGVVYKDGIINKKLIYKIKKSKNEIVFCTGRGYLRSLEIIKPFLETTSTIIVENGSKIVDIFGSKVYSKNISKQDKKIIKYIKPEDIEYIIFNPNGSDYYISYSSIHLKYVEKNYTDFKQFYNAVMENDMTQITIKFKNDKESNYFFDKTKENKINIRKSENNIIINAKGINKKTAIQKYIKKERLHLKDVIVIGNDYNDVEMFNIKCTTKIAVRDEYTPKIIIEKATVVTNFNELHNIIDKTL